jgi:hypothetical protein
MLENYGFSIIYIDFAAFRLQVRDRSEFHLQVSVRGCRIGQVVFRRSPAAFVDTLDVWDDDGGTLP